MSQSKLISNQIIDTENEVSMIVEEYASAFGFILQTPADIFIESALNGGDDLPYKTAEQAAAAGRAAWHEIPNGAEFLPGVIKT